MAHQLPHGSIRTAGRPTPQHGGGMSFCSRPGESEGRPAYGWRHARGGGWQQRYCWGRRAWVSRLWGCAGWPWPGAAAGADLAGVFAVGDVADEVQDFDAPATARSRSIRHGK